MFLTGTRELRHLQLARPVRQSHSAGQLFVCNTFLICFVAAAVKRRRLLHKTKAVYIPGLLISK
jgi:hypothetical protein